MMNVMEEDMRNSTRDFSIETLQTESDQRKEPKFKSYYSYSLKRGNDYERNEVDFFINNKLIENSFCLNQIH